MGFYTVIITFAQGIKKPLTNRGKDLGISNREIVGGVTIPYP
jgi:hypothetical protein